MIDEATVSSGIGASLLDTGCVVCGVQSIGYGFCAECWHEEGPVDSMYPPFPPFCIGLSTFDKFMAKVDMRRYLGRPLPESVQPGANSRRRRAAGKWSAPKPRGQRIHGVRVGSREDSRKHGSKEVRFGN